MKSITTVFKVGNGPSSSHTVGPFGAARYFKQIFPGAAYKVTLFGSLALTGVGHGTKKAICTVLPEAEICFDTESHDIPHPNTMLFEAFDRNGNEIGRRRIFSIGGGSIRIEGENNGDEDEVYAEKNFTEIMKVCEHEDIDLVEYVLRHEGAKAFYYLTDIWHQMEKSVEAGICTEGILPGGLNIERKAKLLYDRRCYNESSDITMERLVSAYSYAVSEENACEQIVVTAPTCGSCGVIPSVMYYMRHHKGFPEREIVNCLAVAGVIGNVIRTNASISGAECGCQAEIGSACSMAAGALAYLYKLNIKQIEYAAEVAMEHNLGLTCDPVMGLVQVPCIERNAVAAMRAINAVNLSRFLYGTRLISFDNIVATMYQTGLDMSEKYRETSHGGLAVIYKQ